MDDEDLATQISSSIPPEAALAARVAQLERHALAADSDRITGYHDERDRASTVDKHFTELEQHVTTNRIKADALLDLVRAALVIAGVAVLIALIALVVAITS